MGGAEGRRCLRGHRVPAGPYPEAPAAELTPVVQQSPQPGHNFVGSSLSLRRTLRPAAGYLARGGYPGWGDPETHLIQRGPRAPGAWPQAVPPGTFPASHSSLPLQKTARGGRGPGRRRGGAGRGGAGPGGDRAAAAAAAAAAGAGAAAGTGEHRGRAPPPPGPRRVPPPGKALLPLKGASRAFAKEVRGGTERRGGGC